MPHSLLQCLQGVDTGNSEIPLERWRRLEISHNALCLYSKENPTCPPAQRRLPRVSLHSLKTGKEPNNVALFASCSRDEGKRKESLLRKPVIKEHVLASFQSAVGFPLWMQDHVAGVQLILVGSRCPPFHTLSPSLGLTEALSAYN